MSLGLRTNKKIGICQTKNSLALAAISTERNPQDRQRISRLELYCMEIAATQGLSQFL